MVRTIAAICLVAGLLAGPALTMAAMDTPPEAIRPTDLRGAAGKLRAAVSTLGDETLHCADPAPGVVVLYCAHGLTTAR